MTSLLFPSRPDRRNPAGCENRTRIKQSYLRAQPDDDFEAWLLLAASAAVFILLTFSATYG